MAARFVSKPPEGWREAEDGTWSVPQAALVSRGSRTMHDELDRFMGHWRTTAQLEAFVVMGQAWFSAVALAMSLAGRWTLNPLMQATIALVVLAHANTILGLVRVGLAITSNDDLDPVAAPRRAVATRTGTIARSRILHVLATVLLVGGLATGGMASAPGFVWVIVTFCALVPWFSLNPRWGLEKTLLQTAQQSLPAGQAT